MSVSWSARLVVLLALVGAACEDPATLAPERPESEFSIFFPTVPRQDSYPAAVIEGTLETRDGCLFVTRDSDRWLLLWPKGYRPLWDGVRLRVFGEKGALVVRRASPYVWWVGRSVRQRSEAPPPPRGGHPNSPDCRCQTAVAICTGSCRPTDPRLEDMTPVTLRERTWWPTSSRTQTPRTP
jgi:hypothetical protein